jgi:hypothetical protein
MYLKSPHLYHLHPKLGVLSQHGQEEGPEHQPLLSE